MSNGEGATDRLKCFQKGDRRPITRHLATRTNPLARGTLVAWVRF